MDITCLRELIGELVRKYRQEKGYSQQALAAICGMNRSYIGAVERGEHNVGLANLARIAAGLDVSLTALLGDASQKAAEGMAENRRDRKEPEPVVLHRDRFMTLLRQCAIDRPDLVTVYLERCGVRFTE